MRLLNIILLVASLVGPNLSLANQTNEHAIEQKPAALSHWQTMLGEWSTTEESLKQDGSGWYATAKADWNFYLALDGWAIRDEYFSPPLSEQVMPPNKRQVGTNMRVYDKDKQQWLMAWMTHSGKSIDAYSAKSDNNQIVMLAKHKNPQGYYSRITFFDMQQDTFEWKMEWSKDGETKWVEVHRINGTRKK